MRKYLKIAFIYLFSALAMGVFYREFTKFQEFSDKTVLSVIHVHLLVLGFVVFILIALLKDKINFEESKFFKPFLIVYNIALPFMAVMFLLRGVLQVLELSLASGFNAMISGIAGISHVLMLVGFILLALSIFKSKFKDEAND